MASFLVVCLGALISVALFYFVTRCALMYEKHICQCAIADMELSKEIVLLVRDVAKEKERLAKHPRIREYLEGINHAFNMQFLDHKKIKVVRVRTFNDGRVALLDDFKSAPKEVKALVQRYSLVLEKIYRRNHPVKWMLNRVWMRMISCIILYILIPILECLQSFLKAGERSGKKKKGEKSAAKRTDYREQLSLEPGRMTVAA